MYSIMGPKKFMIIIKAPILLVLKCMSSLLWGMTPATANPKALKRKPSKSQGRTHGRTLT